MDVLYSLNDYQFPKQEKMGMLRSVEEEALYINQEAGRFYDLYEKDERLDVSFWLEYEAYMSQPVDETDHLKKLVDFVGQ